VPGLQGSVIRFLLNKKRRPDLFVLFPKEIFTRVTISCIRIRLSLRGASINSVTVMNGGGGGS
jgi:hypothetical protein